jgi:hypothetical protein
MPSKSPAQARTMAAAAHNPAFAKRAGIPQGVAKEFNQADTGTMMLRKGMASARAKAMGQGGGKAMPLGQHVAARHGAINRPAADDVGEI